VEEDEEVGHVFILSLGVFKNEILMEDRAADDVDRVVGG